ncbi:hypothetical protein P3X46_018287 [Hevea brasiliensis]|uniref:VHS domain-containing protein n=2 Tax=Hevea brasiliensis TaxID=3981 RepID=A0ABQ9LQB0_HEVBR|nr:TOM1-like protein 5 isoform X1 [Hevea brasiliensis]KAJ9170159.1 hypothetical protein P3X46_018287 [Hevea brasiliensis]
MAAELVNSATSDKLPELDWTKNIEICESVARDKRQARDVVKAIKKRLGSKNPNAQLYSVMLLEMLMNNIGEPVHKEVVDTGVLPILVKIVKKKTDLPVRERIFLLLDATQTSLGGSSGKFPQYYSAYYDLVSAGVQFPQRPQATQANNPASQAKKKSTLNGELTAARQDVVAQQAEPEVVPESSIIQKASNALEILKEVLDAVDSQNPEGAKDEFTLDLVEQCSFQKQRVMHLVMTSRDEKVVSRAIELNEQLQKVLARHDALISGRSMLSVSDRSAISDRTTTTANHFGLDEAEEEEEEPEQLFRRLRKGKACARNEDEGNSDERLSMGMLGSSIPGERERLNRPLIRPLHSDQSSDPSANPPPVVIPPPPAKHMERERFFQEKKVDGSAVSGHMRGLSLHSRNASSSRSGSVDFSD